jgi:hypothetical protein
MKKQDRIIIIGDGSMAYLIGSKALVTIESSKNLFSDPERQPQTFKKGEKEFPGPVYWGDDNALPLDLIEKVYKNPVTTAGLLFNVQLGYGEGIQAGHYDSTSGKRVFVPVEDNAEVNEFFENNDISGYLLEQLTDITFFYNVFPEIILNKAGKVASLKSKEAAFSRWGEMNIKTGLIEHHYYSAKWGKNPMPDDIDITPVLNANNPLRHLRILLGREADDDGKKMESVVNKNQFRYIIPLSFPTPGRSYYQKPYYSSIFDSGWYDYSCKIPEFKNALLDNQQTIKYHVQLAADYFSEIFKAEAIVDPELKAARIKKEYADINKFLSGVKNTGKSIISYVRYTPDGKELPRMKITAIDNNFKGGEYLDDSEEASNIMSYAMSVHPSLIGSSPGKAKTINGTEARELFIIKQSLMKPIRDRILRPLYIIKAINGWDPTLKFVIPNIELTTLDKNTGSTKVIS